MGRTRAAVIPHPCCAAAAADPSLAAVLCQPGVQGVRHAATGGGHFVGVCPRGPPLARHGRKPRENVLKGGVQHRVVHSTASSPAAGGSMGAAWPHRRRHNCCPRRGTRRPGTSSCGYWPASAGRGAPRRRWDVNTRRRRGGNRVVVCVWQWRRLCIAHELFAAVALLGCVRSASIVWSASLIRGQVATTTVQHVSMGLRQPRALPGQPRLRVLQGGTIRVRQGVATRRAVLLAVDVPIRGGRTSSGWNKADGGIVASIAASIIAHDGAIFWFAQCRRVVLRRKNWLIQNIASNIRRSVAHIRCICRCSHRHGVQGTNTGRRLRRTAWPGRRHGHITAQPVSSWHSHSRRSRHGRRSPRHWACCSRVCRPLQGGGGTPRGQARRWCPLLPWGLPFERGRRPTRVTLLRQEGGTGSSTHGGALVTHVIRRSLRWQQLSIAACAAVDRLYSLEVHCHLLPRLALHNCPAEELLLEQLLGAVEPTAGERQTSSVSTPRSSRQIQTRRAVSHRDAPLCIAAVMRLLLLLLHSVKQRS